MALTDVQIGQAKQKAKGYKLTDGGGLYLLLRPNGSKLCNLKFGINDREQKLSFGSCALEQIASRFAATKKLDAVSPRNEANAAVMVALASGPLAFLLKGCPSAFDVAMRGPQAQ